MCQIIKIILRKCMCNKIFLISLIYSDSFCVYISNIFITKWQRNKYIFLCVNNYNFFNIMSK